MKAINNFIIIDKIKEAPSKVAGLELTETQNKDIRYLKGKVISVSDKIDLIKEGDIVRYDKHAGHGIEIDDKMLFVITLGDIVIIE